MISAKVFGCFFSTGRERRAFTLVELLVVIAVVGLLVALLLPAIQAARESARRMACSNNMKQLALATHNYHDVHGVLPPSKFRNITRVGTSKSEDGFNILVFLLPFIEQSAVYDKFTFAENWQNGKNKAAYETVIKTFLCPTVPEPAVRMCRSSTSITSKMEAFYVADYVAAEEIRSSALTSLIKSGAVTQRRDYRSMLQPADNEENPFRSMTFASDGLSNSFMLFECGGRPFKYIGHARGDPDTSPKEPMSGAEWADDDASFWIDEYCGSGQFTNCSNTNEIYAFHQGGSEIAFGDGHVAFIADTIAPEVFVSLFTCAAGDVVVAP